MTLTAYNTSSALETYDLSKRAAELLKKFDKAEKHAKTGGRVLPSVIHLFRPDWVEIDHTVRQQSDGAFNANTVTWRGRELRPA